jgi:hypothetical protein
VRIARLGVKFTHPAGGDDAERPVSVENRAGIGDADAKT